MIREGLRRKAVIGVFVAVVLVGVVGLAIAATYDRPHVEGVESEFGDVGDERADVHTRVVVVNPNDRAVPGGIDLGYVVELNGVAVASGTEPEVRIGPGRNAIETTASFDNAKIPAWWATHVNNGERTVMETRARVGLIGSIGPSLTAERKEVETDLLGPLAEESESTLSLGENDVLVVGDQRAEWGEADDERTPVQFSAYLENVHDREVSLDGTDYEIRMNGVVVGEGETDDGVVLQPGESTTFAVDAAIDNGKMQEWWVSHLENDQSTNLHVEVYAVTADGEERERLPLTVFDRQAAFETDLLGTGETSVTVVDGEPAPSFAEPRVGGTSSEWGEVRDDETDIRTTARVVNENDEAFTDLVTLEVERRTTLAGVAVAEGSTSVDRLPRGEGDVEMTTTKSHSVVPEWWAAHLRNGEVSTTRTEIDGEADVGITTIPLDLEDREGTVETDTLGGLNDDSRRQEGPLTIHSTSATWCEPTAEEATILVEADISNDNPLSSVTIRELDYVVDINDVGLADDRAPEAHTFAPGERRTVEFTLVLNNSRMAEWWPTHVRNGEVSRMDRDVSATIETDGRAERRDMAFLSESVEIETDLLADE